MRLCQQTLQDWDRDNLLAPDGLLVAEERAGREPESQLTTLELIDQRTYGDTAFRLFRRRRPDSLPNQTT